MKKIYLALLLLLILPVKALAQQVPDKVFKLDKLSQQDILPQGWKISPGDNPQWAQPGFDDHKWANCDSLLEQIILDSKSDHFWLRLHLLVDSSLKTTDFAFIIYQNVASVIYVDGKPVKSYGSIVEPVKMYDPLGYPIPVKLSAGSHVVAVQLVASKFLLKYRDIGSLYLTFSLEINAKTNAENNHAIVSAIDRQFSDHNLLLIGMFFILTITHLASYLYYRKQKAHLYYAIITFILLFATLTNFTVTGQHSPVVIFWLSLIAFLGFIGFVFLPLTIYELFDYRGRLVIKIILSFSVICVSFIWINTTYAYYLLFYVTPLVNALECLRIGIWALKAKKSGAVFIIAGSFLFLSLLVLSNLIPGDWGELLFMFSQISLPVGMTVFLAIRTAITYRSLELKFVEVQELLHQNTKYQAEKQELLAGQNEKLELLVTKRTAELSQSLSELKAAQNQLVQSAKMASLGELTAGIAHEIQNPLNFVNNFSEVNTELIDEMQEEIDKGDFEEVKAIANDIKENQQKINQHGKRADFIVKGMLQHSRTSTGEKQLTNINTLADEFLKLSYHGLRAKDKTFNTELVTNFDDELPVVNVVQQDIGRVLLNLFNNAFYAVSQKQKKAGNDYKPEVSVTTSAENGQVIIKVKDNGIGIPDGIKEKIMQPFFTTKPTGEGTGLGLSLTYDMVVKGHGGKIEVNTKEGAFTEFVISLPLG
ncbi:ATP-binding protein [Mucilaginibacter flavidus]|uniref:ATP-binding protein n=1 Tax=Mucilaginibacter flavidus TaxID=2949309 RepID=UPI0020939890|nr:ATP-binding protein [Mucilaginibacter flavidus]MCO5948390.1 ATP-binding protein [Mucilaginibacter flavidus]